MYWIAWRSAVGPPARVALAAPARAAGSRRRCGRDGCRRCSARSSSCRCRTRRRARGSGRPRTSRSTPCSTSCVPYAGADAAHAHDRLLAVAARRASVARGARPSTALLAPTSRQRQQRTRCSSLGPVVGRELPRGSGPRRSRSARRTSSRPAAGPGSGARPGMPRSAYLPARSGTEAMRRRVYGCDAPRNSVSLGPTSTRRPAYMTAMRSARLATTARSWVT